MEEAVIKERAKIYVRQETVAEFKQEVQDLLDKEDWSELAERFTTPISFGTGGLRGLIGGGDARMNPLNVRRASQGIASYIAKNVSKEKHRVVISYDSRHYSEEFALEASLVFAANGIKTFLYSKPRPTPQLSYSVRQLEAASGVMITASHNSKEYNGYKVYWEDGAQIVNPHDKGIIQEVRTAISKIPELSKEKAIERGLLEYISDDLDQQYTTMVLNQSICPQLFENIPDYLKIIYTPLHGIGSDSVKLVLDKLKVPFTIVPSQEKPDGNFPTIKLPNPEEHEAMALAVKLGKEQKAKLILGTDPDVDRLGLGVLNKQGDYQLLSGNQIGSLFLDYICQARRTQNKLSLNSIFFNTIVSSPLHGKIATFYGIKHQQVLTGFKYIGEQMRLLEKTGINTFLFGCEESYGFLVENEVRDKDAVSAILMAVELLLWNESQGRTVLDHLNNIYDRFGFFDEIQINRSLQGNAGKRQIANMMWDLAGNPREYFGDKKIIEFIDYRKQVHLNYQNNSHIMFKHLPSSEVLQFNFDDSSTVLVRPSGTEPKIKFYVFTTSNNANLEEAQKEVQARLEEYKGEVLKILDKKH